MDSIPIVVPSRGRAGSVKVLEWLPDAILAVPYDQGEAYRKAYPDARVVTLDSHTRGGIQFARQWIYDAFGDCFMIDDDITGVRTLHHIRNRTLTAQEVHEVVNAAAATARDLGAYLFGFNKSCNPRWYNPSVPFKLSGDCPGYSMGLLRGSRLHFDERCFISEDTFISCLNAYHHRHAFFDLRFAVSGNDMAHVVGGCSTFRTQKIMGEMCDLMRKLFGDVIQPWHGKGSSLGGDSYSVCIPF